MKNKVYNLEQLKTIFNVISKLDLNKGYEVSYNKIKVSRTLSQNRLYWLYVACICKETGYDNNLLHDQLRKRFLQVKEVEIFGTIEIELTSTTKLDTIQFKKYIDNIIVLASEIGIILPNPEDKHFKEFEDFYSRFL
jgi:hypothetical protein